MKFKKIIITILIFASFGSLFGQSSMTIGQAIAVAARQKMLTQRMAKARVCKSAGIKTDFSQAELNASMTTFEENLKLLSRYAPSQKIRAKLDKVQTLWTDFKAALQNDSTQTGAIFVMGFNSRMLSVCDETATELLEYAKTLATDEREGFAPEAISEAANIADRTRTLAQRFALYYTANFSDLDPNAVRQLKGIAENIDKNVNALAVQETNTTEITDAVSEIQKDWKTVKEQFGKTNDFNFAEKKMEPIQIFELSNNMFQKLDKITVLYANLFKK
ncbi:MAG: hypothetical protein RL757_120 [Bacteroidota bacterium]|jgi:hypothetical protein